MRLFTPSRLIALVAVAAALVSPAVALGVAWAGTSRHAKQACVRGQALLERNKANVVAYYETAFNAKQPRLAVERYGGDEYIQHNPLADNGFDAFIQFVETFTTAFPDTHIDIRRVIAECDMVVTHAVLTGEAYGDFGSKVVDIFRLDANGKIVEHWDVLAAQGDPADSADGHPEVWRTTGRVPGEGSVSLPSPSPTCRGSALVVGEQREDAEARARERDFVELGIPAAELVVAVLVAGRDLGVADRKRRPRR